VIEKKVRAEGARIMAGFEDACRASVFRWGCKLRESNAEKPLLLFRPFRANEILNGNLIQGRRSALPLAILFNAFSVKAGALPHGRATAPTTRHV